MGRLKTLGTMMIMLTVGAIAGSRATHYIMSNDLPEVWVNQGRTGQENSYRINIVNHGSYSGMTFSDTNGDRVNDNFSAGYRKNNGAEAHVAGHDSDNDGLIDIVQVESFDGHECRFYDTHDTLLELADSAQAFVKRCDREQR